jgi:hypothetical protein
MLSSGMLRRVALVRIDVSKERITIIRMTRIDELETTLAVTSNRSTQEPHGVTSQKTAFLKKYCMQYVISLHKVTRQQAATVG